MAVTVLIVFSIALFYPALPVVKAANPWDAYNYAPASRTVTPAAFYNTYASNYDYVHPGDTTSESVHSFQHSGTSVANTETVLRRCTGGGSGTWISYNLKVPTGQAFTVRVDETASVTPTTKDYWVQINGTNVYHRIRTTHLAWGSCYAGVASYVFDVPASYASTGTVTIKFVSNNSNPAGDPSIAGVWTLGGNSLPDSGRGGSIANLNNLLTGGSATLSSNSGSYGAPYVILDFGKSIAGTVSFTYSCSGTQNLKFCYSNSGYYVGVAGDAQEDVKIVKDESQNVSLTGSGTWTCDTLRGAFRYLMLMKTNAGSINISNVSVAYSAAPLMSNPSAYTGYFYCNDDTINKVWYAGAYTSQICTINPNTSRGGSSSYGAWANKANCGPGTSIFTDGGKRDRLVWDGDLAIAFPTAYLSYNDTTSTKNALTMVYDGQDANGALKDCSLFRYSDVYHCWGVYAFADFILYTNDTTFLNSYWTRFKNAVSYMTGKISNGLYNTGGGNWSYTEDANSTEASSIVYMNLLKAAQLADIKGESSTATSYRNTATTIKNAINSQLWDSKGAYVESTGRRDKVSTLGTVLPITYGIADSAKTSSVLSYLNTYMKNSTGYYTVDYAGGVIPKNNSLYVGGHLLRALITANNATEAVNFMRTTWGSQLTSNVGNGSTFWETLGDDGLSFYDAYDSFGHVWSSGPTSVLTEYILGVKPETPGYVTYKVLPNPGGLTHVEGKVPVPGSKNITVSYDTNNNNSFSMTVNSSGNGGSTGTVGVPKFGKTVTVKVNNITVWDGTFHPVTGIGGANEDSKYVNLTSVQPGSYSITTVYGTAYTPTPTPTPTPTARPFTNLYDPGSHSAVQLTGSNTAGEQFTAANSFDILEVCCPSWSNNTGNLTLKLFAWNTNYATSVGGTALASQEFVNFTDNAWLRLTFTARPAGTYVWQLSNPVETVGVWKADGSANPSVAFLNGSTTSGDYESRIYYLSGPTPTPTPTATPTPTPGTTATPTPTPSQYDYVDAGESTSESAHNLQKSATSGANTEAGYTRRYSGYGTAGSWFSYDVTVPVGINTVKLEIRETYDGVRTRDYNIYLDGVLLEHYSNTSTGAGAFIYTRTPTGLSSRTGDGKLTIKFEEENPAQNYEASVADVWVKSN